MISLQLILLLTLLAALFVEKQMLTNKDILQILAFIEIIII